MTDPVLTPGVPQLLRWEDDPGWQEAQRAIKEAEASARRKQKAREAWEKSPAFKKSQKRREARIAQLRREYFTAYLRSQGIKIPRGQLALLEKVYDIGASDGYQSSCWYDHDKPFHKALRSEFPDII